MFRARSTFYWALLIVALVCVLPVYWPSLRYDLYQDDYFLLRPWRPERLWSVLTGPWVGPEYTEFYRPITIYSYKAMVYLFGLNTRALHVIPLVTTTLVAWLVGVFVFREVGSRPAAVTGTVVAALHPSTTISIGPFLSNQYQGWIAALVLLALLGWQNSRNQSWRAWQPLWVPCLLAALLKESGLMLPLIIVTLHTLRHAWLGDVRPTQRRVAIAGVGLFLAFNLLRLFSLEGLGGYGGLSDPMTSLLNVLRAPYDVILQPHAAPPWSIGFAVVSMLLTLLGLWTLARHRFRPEAKLVLTGAVIFLMAAIPTSQMMSPDRGSPHQIGAVLMLTGGAWSAVRLLRSRLVLVPLTALALWITTAVTVDAVDAFNPCNGNLLAATLSYEASVAPPEMVRWHNRRPRPCNPETHVPFYQTTSRITWGVDEEVIGPNNVLQHWRAPRVIGFIDQRATAVAVRIRHLGAGPGRTVRIEVRTNRGPAAELLLTSPNWFSVTVPLHQNWNVWLRQMHRVELVLDDEDADLTGMIMRPFDAIY